MPPIGVSPNRDRTAEFRSLSDRLKKKIHETAAVHRPENHDDSTPGPSPNLSFRSDFNKKASRIGLGIHETSLKIAWLAKSAKRSSKFDDPIVEIQELTALIKSDIAALNKAISDLYVLQNMEMASGYYTESDDGQLHSSAVCGDLKNRLMEATKQLQDILTTRTENMKAQESRKKIFSTNATRETPFKNTLKAVNEPPPWSRPFSQSEGSQASVLPSNGVQVGSQLRRRLAVDNPPSPHMEESMLQQVVPRQEIQTQSRAVALQNVESTITELSGIFTNLATLVAQQGELAIRIDDNMDESLANVEGARSSLLKHLNRITSNRWLLIKIFVVLIIFLMVFVFIIS